MIRILPQVNVSGLQASYAKAGDNKNEVPEWWQLRSLAGNTRRKGGT